MSACVENVDEED